MDLDKEQMEVYESTLAWMNSEVLPKKQAIDDATAGMEITTEERAILLRAAVSPKYHHEQRQEKTTLLARKIAQNQGQGDAGRAVPSQAETSQPSPSKPPEQPKSPPTGSTGALEEIDLAEWRTWPADAQEPKAYYGALGDKEYRIAKNKAGKLYIAEKLGEKEWAARGDAAVNHQDKKAKIKWTR